MSRSGPKGTVLFGPADRKEPSPPVPVDESLGDRHHLTHSHTNSQSQTPISVSENTDFSRPCSSSLLTHHLQKSPAAGAAEHLPRQQIVASIKDLINQRVRAATIEQLAQLPVLRHQLRKRVHIPAFQFKPLECSVPLDLVQSINRVRLVPDYRPTTSRSRFRASRRCPV